jgi:RHS repeat-associated protein
VSGPNGYKESYTYDAVSRLVKTTYTLDGQTFVMQTTYDAFSRVDKVTYPGGFKIRNKYTAQGYFKEVRNDADNALYWRADTINARGQIERATFGNNLATKQQFDANTGLLRTIQTGPTGSPSHVQNLSFTFDALGNLTSRKDTRQNLTESFRYDALNRLTSAQVTGRDAQTLQYDMLGNITFKSDVGSYSYGSNGAGPHAVTAISGGMSASFGYDANGNRTSSTGGSISYTSFNLPTTLVQGSNRITYAYGPNHERYKRTVQVSSVTTTTLMIGALYEKETVGALTTQNYYIPAAGRVVAMQVVRSNGVNNTLYLHRDHLGSLETITGPTGNVIERLSYDAWGKRRTADWRSINAAITSLVRRGYTGHEQLDEVGLIHMNGRVYDPTLGRFLSPDPFVQAPDFSQSLNRYSYVLNNPLSLTDPSGFNWFSDAWKGIKDFFEDNWKTIVVAAVTIATMIWAPGISTGLWATIFKGAMAGFAGSVTSSMLYGGSLSDALQAGARGALIGGITAGAFFGVGKIFGHQAAFASATHVKKIIAHGIVGGASEMLQGGKFAHGFLSGAFTQAFAPGIDLIDKSNSGINSYRTIAAAIVGGTAAEIGGGKFANGAITGAFSRMYNDDGAEWEARRYFGQAANSNAAALQQFGSSLVKIPVEIGTRIIHLGAAYSELLLSGINFVGMSATSAAGLPLAEAAEVLQPLLMAHPSTANFARSIEVWQPLLDSVGKLDFSNLTDTYHANSKYHWQQYQAHANCAFGPSCGW